MKKAYTLSEVLVVLLVLGIIAAFIIPAVMRTAPDRSALLYKKTFYSLQEAASNMINDPNMYPKGDVDGSGDAKQGLFTDKTSKEFCEDLANSLSIIGNADCSSAKTDGDPNFITTNGVIWWNVGGGNFDFNGEDTIKSKIIKVQCSGSNYKIRIYANGKVGTDASTEDGKCISAADDNWNCENAILKQPFKFRDLNN